MEIKDDVVFELLMQDIKGIAKEISAINVTLAKQAKDIEMHIKRTDLLEDALSAAKEELLPTKNFTTFLKVGLQIFGGVSVVLGIAVGVIKVLQYLA